MRPLPHCPDFPLVKCAHLPAGKRHHLELWNPLPDPSGKILLDYVQLSVREQGKPPETFISSRPYRDGFSNAGQEHGSSGLGPVCRLGLLAVTSTELELAFGRDRGSLVAELVDGECSWGASYVDIDGYQMEFYLLSWDHGWSAVGHYPGTTISVVSRVGEAAGMRLATMAEDEVVKLTRSGS